jgi:hypothetical protein
MTPGEDRSNEQDRHAAMIRITIALLLLALATAAYAGDIRFHDAHGRITGSAPTLTASPPSTTAPAA